MSDIFLLIALILAIVVALLYFMPHLKLLNVVDYGEGDAVKHLNRCAALRLLFPVGVNLACAYVVGVQPELAVPLIFLTPVSILCAVIWICAGERKSKLLA